MDDPGQEIEAKVERLLFTVEQAAEMLNLNRTTVYALIKRAEAGEDGGLRSVKIGRRRLIPGKAINEFVEYAMDVGSIPIE